MWYHSWGDNSTGGISWGDHSTGGISWGDNSTGGSVGVTILQVIPNLMPLRTSSLNKLGITAISEKMGPSQICL